MKFKIEVICISPEMFARILKAFDEMFTNIQQFQNIVKTVSLSVNTVL